MDELKKENLKSIQLMAEREKLVAILYRRFEADLNNKEFWRHIAHDEDEHEAWLKGLMPEIEGKELTFVKDRFDNAAIEATISVIKDLIEKVKKSEYLGRDALSYALDIESSLLEKNFFITKPDDEQKLRDVLNALEKGTQKHRQMVEAELSKE